MLAGNVSVGIAPNATAQLDALQQSLNSAAAAELGATWSSYQDAALDRVVLDVPAGTDLSRYTVLASLVSAHTDETTVLTDYTSAALTACDQWTCPPPMRGGLESDEAANAFSGGYLCTTSFLAAPNVNTAARFILSAGHCETTNNYHSPGPNDAFFAGPLIGNMNNYGNGDKNDSEAISLGTVGGGYSASSEATIYQRGYTTSSADLGYHTVPSNEHFAVTGTASDGQYVSGTFLCKSARTTFYTCGSINRLNVSTQACESGTSVCYDYNSFFGSSICVNGGDSGGPIYSSNSAGTGGLAYGIVSSSTTYSTCDSSSETYSATIPNVEVGLGVTILTMPAPTGTPLPVV